MGAWRDRGARDDGRAGSAIRAFTLLAMGLLAGCGDAPAGLGPDEPADSTSVLTDGVERYTYRVVARHPHDPDAFTQGLVLDDGVLFEGTGLRGASSLRRVDLRTGVAVQQRALPAHLFGEGITVVGDAILQLTWKAGRGFVYDRESFDLRREFSYPTEGWGLTYDGSRLVMSDGTAELRFLDPTSFARVRTLPVHDDGVPVTRLNELELIDGHVFANVWKTDRIAIIDPATGAVVSWLDLSGLLPPEDRADAGVLNGIAFDAEHGHVLVTGKLWPWLYEIVLVPVSG